MLTAKHINLRDGINFRLLPQSEMIIILVTVHLPPKITTTSLNKQIQLYLNVLVFVFQIILFLVLAIVTVIHGGGKGGNKQ